eukprot:g800.t1
MAAEGYGSNDAALSLKDQELFVTKDGIVLEDRDPKRKDLLRLRALPGTFLPTQASRIIAKSVGLSSEIHGIVFDWGCGGGLLSLIAALKADVKLVIGMDYEERNVKVARKNAHTNNLAEKTWFCVGDSFLPFSKSDQVKLQKHVQGKVDCIIANPPASKGDDGFSFRRRILREAPSLLKTGGVLFIQALSYYGSERCKVAAQEASKWFNASEDVKAGKVPPHCFVYAGIELESPWMELGAGIGGYDLRPQLQQYADIEMKAENEARYYCGPPSSRKKIDKVIDETELQTAVEALNAWSTSGQVPLCKWCVHKFYWKVQ